MVVSILFVLLQAAQVPTFSTQVQVVGVTISATDVRTGAPVSDLKPGDFVVLEDGRRQEIQLFERKSVPASIVILLDTSSSMKGLLPSIRDAASRLIHSLRPVDEVQVATFDERYRILSDFTTDHEMASASLAGVRQGSDTALNWALYTATRFLEQSHRDEVGRRRILILLSDGENTHDSFSYEMAEDALRRSRVVCYVVHLQRMTLEDPSVLVLTDPATRFIHSIVYETGGQLLSVREPYDHRVIASAFSGIAAELGNQYHLAYSSSAEPTRSGWRDIGVVMTSRSNVRLRFRRGYYVPPRR